MTNVRAVSRLAALMLVTGVLALAWTLGAPLAKIARRAESWRSVHFQAWASAVCSILGMRVRVDGAAPRGAFLLVANHVSYVDVVLLASLVRSAFVAKSEVARWPVIGVLARMMGNVFVDRERKHAVGRVAEHMRARLAAGEALILFPEGTSTAGDSVRAFHSSLLAPAASLAIPVRYAAIRYATPAGWRPASLSVAWWGEMRFGAHFLDLLRLPHFDAWVSFGAEPLHSPDRKALAAELQRAVSARLTPAVQHA